MMQVLRAVQQPTADRGTFRIYTRSHKRPGGQSPGKAAIGTFHIGLALSDVGLPSAGPEYQLGAQDDTSSEFADLMSWLDAVVGPDGREYLVVLAPERAPGFAGYINARVPSLPGCQSYGYGRTETLDNIAEAIAAYVDHPGEASG